MHRRRELGGLAVAVAGLKATAGAIERRVTVATRQVDRIADRIAQARGLPPHQQEPPMVAKVSGFARLAGIVHDLNSNSGSLADQLASQLQDEAEKIKAGMATASNNVANVRKTREELDALNAAFGNGGPPLAGS